MNMLLPVVGSLFGLFRNQAVGGVSAQTTHKVVDALQTFITSDEKARALIADYAEQARKHDVATYDAQDRLTNRMRSCVRPVCTFIALGWYVYARANGIALMAEDYAIIGGILAFWFGFRPFEKNR
jgi:hypothetical protein